MLAIESSSPLGGSQATGSEFFQLLKGFGKVLVEFASVFGVDIDPLEVTLVLQKYQIRRQHHELSRWRIDILERAIPIFRNPLQSQE